MNLAAARNYRLKNSLLAAVVLLLLASCSVKDFPVGKPYVYEANIHVESPGMKGDDRKELETRIRQQLHDSIAVRRTTKLFIFTQLKNPPVYDSLNASASIGFIDALMRSLGYFRDSARYTAKIDTVKTEIRTVVDFYVRPGKQTLIDSISMALNDTTAGNAAQKPLLDTIQAVTQRNLAASLLKKGKPFAKPLISSELDRLVDIYHNTGFLRLSREQMLIVWDTVGLALLRPTFDPVEQARLLEALQRRRENPVADIEYRLRPAGDSLLRRYYIGNITIYPDLTVENAKLPPPTPVYDTSGMVIRAYGRRFINRTLVQNTYIRRGSVYDQRVVQRTANRFNALPAWRIASVEPVPRPGTDSVDMVVRLTPAQRYAYDLGLEASQNLGGLFVGSNLVGINFSLRDRNFARRAIQATYSVGLATELNSEVTQTIQTSGAYSLVFPKLIWPLHFHVPYWPKGLPLFPLPMTNPYRTTLRSSLGLSARYIHRIDYLDLLGLNASWGYEGSRGTSTASTRFNVEYTSVNRMSILNDLIANNKSYQYIFNDGLILSTVFGRSWIKTTDSVTRIWRVGVEFSGILSGLIATPFLDQNLKRFIKGDVTFTRNKSLGNNQVLALRGLVGVGYSLAYSNDDSNRRYMPFFRAYFAGGANSMRGWTLRRLGPGSSSRSFARDSFPERFGDMQLEANVEYRFRIANFGGVIINSALFGDFGNVWYIRKNPSFPDGEFQFDLNKIGRDIAIDMGTGIRLEFGTFLKLRLDYAFKVKDPSAADPALQNKWFPNFDILKGTVQLGVDYPF